MSVKNMSSLIGRVVSVRFESISVHCRITDVKVSYGKPRLLIMPVSGSDTQWIETARVIAFLDGANGRNQPVTAMTDLFKVA